MITLSKSGSTITFTFDENSGYLQNGTIEVPVNSLSLVIDNSDMVTFKKSASNDIFVSALVGQFGMTKAELEAWYKENMVGSTGGGIDSGTVQTMIYESISGKADSANAVASAEYVSSSSTIDLKNISGTVISQVDASDFIIDGMIDDVRIETLSGTTYLVIDFNTESGKEDILIPLTDIFDPSNYYTKSDVDAALSGKANSSDVYLKTETSGATEISTALNNKANKSEAFGGYSFGLTNNNPWISFDNVNHDKIGKEIYYSTINGKDIITSNGTWAGNNLKFSLVETSAITSAVTSASTDSEIPTAKAVFDAVGQGGGGNPTIELTQAEYDALVSAGTVSEDTYYIITDATPIDMSQYWTSAQTNSAITQATSGKVETSAITSAVTSASTDSEIPTAKAVFDAVGQGGGGKAVSGGTNISITTGATADTINCTVPASASSGNYSIMFGQPASSGDASGPKSIIGGQWCKAYGEGSVAIGQMNESSGSWAWAIGDRTSALGEYAFACGANTIANNKAEFTCGYGTITSGGSDTSIMTLFTVGNGKWKGGVKRHNALDIRQNGDIYVVDTNDTSTSNYWEKPMIKLQDHLGGGGTVSSAITSGDTNPVQGGVLYDKFDEIEQVTARALVNLNDSIPQTTSAVTSGSTAVITSAGVYQQMGGLKLQQISQSDYDNLPTKDASTLYVILE